MMSKGLSVARVQTAKHGAGVIDILAALAAKQAVSPKSIALGAGIDASVSAPRLYGGNKLLPIAAALKRLLLHHNGS